MADDFGGRRGCVRERWTVGQRGRQRRVRRSPAQGRRGHCLWRPAHRGSHLGTGASISQESRALGTGAGRNLYRQLRAREGRTAGRLSVQRSLGEHHDNDGCVSRRSHHSSHLHDRPESLHEFRRHGADRHDALLRAQPVRCRGQCRCCRPVHLRARAQYRGPATGTAQAFRRQAIDQADYRRGAHGSEYPRTDQSAGSCGLR